MGSFADVSIESRGVLSYVVFPYSFMLGSGMM